MKISLNMCTFASKAEEHLALVFRVDHGPEPVAHAVAHHHVAGHLRGALEVVRSAGRHLVH